jgi:hypothetical protein
MVSQEEKERIAAKKKNKEQKKVCLFENELTACLKSTNRMKSS